MEKLRQKERLGTPGAVVGPPILGFGSGHGFEVMRSSLVPGSKLGSESA